MPTYQNVGRISKSAILKMPNYRRYHLKNIPYFITVVTSNRKKIFTKRGNLELLRNILKNVQNLYPFKMLAYAFLPDHLHMLILPKKSNEDNNISKIVHSLKRNFTLEYKKLLKLKKSPKIWQNRFWDHMIRNEKDFQKHLDYIHFNPVKHKIVFKPEDFLYSSFKYWVKKGAYQIGWGHIEPENIKDMKFE